METNLFLKCDARDGTGEQTSLAGTYNCIEIGLYLASQRTICHVRYIKDTFCNRVGPLQARLLTTVHV